MGVRVAQVASDRDFAFSTEVHAMLHRIWVAIRVVVSLFVAGHASQFAAAADVVKASNQNALNQGTAWVGGTAPASGDVGVWNSTVSATNTSTSPTLNQLGADVAWQGIEIGNVGGTANQSGNDAGVQIRNTSSTNTITLGSAGIDMSAATQALLTQAKITLAASQVWDITNANTSPNPFGGNGINAGLSEDLMLNAQTSSAAFSLGGNTLTLQGNGSVGVTSGYALSNGTLNLNNTGAGGTWIQSGGSRTSSLASSLTVTVGAGSNLRLRANSGSGGIGVNSQAPITISGAGAKLQLENNNGGTSVIQSGALDFGTGTTFEAILNNSGPVTVSGPITTAGSLTWNVSGAGGSGAANAAGVALSGNVTGSGAITYQNTATATNGQVRLSGDNSGYSGSMTVNGASGNRSLRLTSATAGSSSATWSVAAANTLELDGVTVSLGALTGAGTVTNSHATLPATVSVGEGSFSGLVSNGAGTGGLGLTKTGAGSLTLSGANSYSGPTTVTGGTLAVTTAQTGGGSFTVADAATVTVAQMTGAATLAASTFTLGSTGGATLALTPTSSQSVAVVTAAQFDINGPTTLSVLGEPATGDRLVSYGALGGASGFGGLSLELPFRVSGTLVNNTTDSRLELANVVVNTPVWSGSVSNVWNIDTTSNWLTAASQQATTYVQAGPGQTDSVIFNDAASGPTAIDVAAAVAPIAFSIDNSTLGYSFTGSGSIAGSTSIIKSGTAPLTLGLANTFTGGVQVNAGTLNVNSATALGTGTLALAGGVTLDNTSGASITATNAQTWNGDFTVAGTNDLALGAAALSASRQVTVSAGTFSVAGISGAFGLTKAGPGTLAVGASSYSGPTTVNGGTLRATSTGSFINTAVTLADAAGVVLDLNGNSQTIASLTGGGASGGNVVLGGGTLTTSSSGTIGGLSGAGGLVKTGSSTFTIAGDKTGYTGSTTVSGGTLDLGTISGGFGTGFVTGSGSIFVQGNGSLTTGLTGGSSGFSARGGDFVVNVGGAGAIVNLTSSGANGLGGVIFGSANADSRVVVQNEIGINNFNGSRTFTVNTGTGTASAELAGVVSNGAAGGANGITKTGAGDLILSAANTITGSTTISAGRIVLGNELGLQYSSLNTDNAGRLVITGFTTPTLGGLTGAASLASFVDAGYGALSTLTLAPQAGRSLVFDGIIADGATGMNLVKSGVGTQTLNAASSYTGSTTISGGTLALGASGSIATSSGIALVAGSTFDVSAKSGGYTVATLSGSGTVNGGILVTDELAIGSSPGTMNFSSDLTLGGTSTYTYEVTSGPNPGLGSADLGNVSGTLTIASGAALDLVELGTYTVGNKFTLFGYTGGISGTFFGLPDGSEFLDAQSNPWRIDYADTTSGLNGGTGTGFVNITAVPEPAVALLGGLGLLALLRLRRLL